MTGYVIICAAVILAAVLVSVLITNYYKKKTKETIDGIMKRLDSAIMGKQTDVKYDELMESALGKKLNRYIDITAEQNEKMANEKESIKSLISDIAHQTKTPLSNIILLTQIVQEQDNLPEDSRQMITDVSFQAEKLSALINIMVKTSYLEGGLIQVHPKKDSIQIVLNETCSEIKVTANIKNINIEMNNSNKECKYDYKWTKEALLNILDNAIKYSPEGSVIKIKTIDLEMFTRIDVKDEGIGIDEKEIGLIFTRFYRSPEVSRIEGVGVGLYLAREIIAMEGGYIKVLSEKGAGTTFSIYLPN